MDGLTRTIRIVDTEDEPFPATKLKHCQDEW